jgi:tRNA A37 N6-isopentenylltransferase MiaA
MSLTAALDEMRRQTRRYARRQLTWFRNQLPADTMRLDALLPLTEQVERVVAHWEQRRGKGIT